VAVNVIINKNTKYNLILIEIKEHTNFNYYYLIIINYNFPICVNARNKCTCISCGSVTKRRINISRDRDYINTRDNLNKVNLDKFLY